MAGFDGKWGCKGVGVKAGRELSLAVPASIDKLDDVEPRNLALLVINLRTHLAESTQPARCATKDCLHFAK
jgi:hypothetical protein